MRSYDPKEGRYKDQSIGDTPKVYTITVDGRPMKVVGAGCKNGGYLRLAGHRRPDRRAHTDLYRPAGLIRFLRSRTGGCWPCQAASAAFRPAVRRTGRRSSPTASTRCCSARRKSRPPAECLPPRGRVVAISLDTKTERWRHERPRVRLDRRPAAEGGLHGRRRPGRLGHRGGQWRASISRLSPAASSLH